jgi:hypothetical protein
VRGPFKRCWYCGNPPSPDRPWGVYAGIYGHYDPRAEDWACPDLPDGWHKCAGCAFAQPPGKWSYIELTYEEYLIEVAERGGRPLGESDDAWCADEEACIRLSYWDDKERGS